MLFLHSSSILCVFKIVLKRLVSQRMPSSPKPLHTSIGMLYGPTAFVLPIFLRASPTSLVVITLADPSSSGLSYQLIYQPILPIDQTNQQLQLTITLIQNKL